MSEHEITVDDLPYMSLDESCLQLAEDEIALPYLGLEGCCSRHQPKLGLSLPPALCFEVIRFLDNRRISLTPDPCENAREVKYWLDRLKSEDPKFLWLNKELDILARWGIPLLSDPRSNGIPGGKYTYERLISVERLLTSAGLAVSTRAKLR